MPRTRIPCRGDSPVRPFCVPAPVLLWIVLLFLTGLLAISILPLTDPMVRIAEASAFTAPGDGEDDAEDDAEDAEFEDAEARADVALLEAVNLFNSRPRQAQRPGRGGGRGAGGGGGQNRSAEEMIFESEEKLLEVVDSHAGTRASREALFWIAECQRELREFETAREGYESAISADPAGPNGATAHLGLALCRLELGDPEGAIPILVRIEEEFGDSPRIADAFYHHGAALRELERYQEAAQIWDRLLVSYAASEPATRAGRERDTLRPVRERLAEWIPLYEAAKEKLENTPKRERAAQLDEVGKILDKIGGARAPQTEQFLSQIIQKEGGDLRAKAVGPLLEAGGPRAAQLLVKKLDTFDEPTLSALLKGLERRHLEKTRLSVFVEFLNSGGKPALQLAAIDCFGRVGSAEAVDALIATIPEAENRDNLSTTSKRAVDRVGRQLRRLRDEKAIETLGKVVEKRHEAQLRRVVAADSLGFTRRRSAFESLRAGLFDPSSAVAAASVRSLGRLKAEEFATEIGRLLIERRRDLEFLRDAAQALGRFDPTPAEEQLLVISVTPDVPLRTLVIRTLGKIRTETSLDRIIEALTDTAWQVRSAALEATAGWGRARVVDALVALLEREQGALRPAIIARLITLLGVDKGPDPRFWREYWEFARKDFDENAALAEGEAGEGAAERRTFVRKADPDAVRSPSYFGVEIISRRLAFIIDVSGSMSAEVSVPSDDGSSKTMRRIDLAREELIHAIDALAPGTFFNLVKFDQTPVSMEKKLQKLTKSSATKAKKFAGGLQPAGGTNIYDSLAMVLEAGDVDTIYLLSDGEPSAGTYTDPTRILEEIARLNEASQVTIHTIALGFDSGFMRQLAEQNRGSYVVAGR